MTSIPLEQFHTTFGSLIEISSASLGGKIVSVSDDFFASATNLLSVHPSVNMKGQFGPNGALFDGWESRRHNTKYDWVIIRLGAPLGTVEGVDIDTGNFNGNESPASDVWGARVPEGEEISEDSQLWQQLLPLTPLSPASRHVYKFASASSPITHMKLTMHPDGGIGRFRAYGHVLPPPPTTSPDVAVDLAHVLNGGRVVDWSDQHYGVAGNLILPGRGKDMGDGWETKRSRGRLGTGQGDWVVIKLGEAGYLEWVDLDSRHFCGNFPNEVEVFATISDATTPPADTTWTSILAKQKPGPHSHHYYKLERSEQPWTHIRVVIHPDGGLKRVRVFGRRVSQFPNFALLTPLESPEPEVAALERGDGKDIEVQPKKPKFWLW